MGNCRSSAREAPRRGPHTIGIAQDTAPPRTSARLRPTAGSRHENVHSLFARFCGFTQPCTGVPSCQYRAEPARGAYAAPASEFRPTVATEPSTVPGTDPTRRASNARGAQIQTLTTFRVASPPPNQARMRNHFFEAAVPGGTMAVPRIGRPTTT